MNIYTYHADKKNYPNTFVASIISELGEYPFCRIEIWGHSRNSTYNDNRTNANPKYFFDSLNWVSMYYIYVMFREAQTQKFIQVAAKSHSQEIVPSCNNEDGAIQSYRSTL